MRRSFFLMCYTNYSLFWMEAVNDDSVFTNGSNLTVKMKFKKNKQTSILQKKKQNNKLDNSNR